MKIVFLNTWNGKIRDGITEFIKEHSRNTDVFCFQEVYPEMRFFCKEILPDYAEFYAYKFVVKDDDFPQATYVNKKINNISSSILFDRQLDCGLGVNVIFSLGNNNVHICNFHGLSKPGNKLDNSNRLKQSKYLIDFFRDKDGQKIIGGDFNLLPDTKSIQIFKENGYRDLIKDFNIKTTRNRLSWEMYPDNPQYHSDYVFLSPEVKIKKFSVPDVEISDHLPLILEIEV
jgi:exonuclease III